jgi:hypothetical protein
MKLPGLCQVCHNCIVNQAGLQETEKTDDTLMFAAHKSAESLVAASNAGCTICSLLWMPLSPAQKAVLSSTTVKEELTVLLIMPDLLNVRGSWSLIASITSQALKELRSEPKLQNPYFVLSPRQGTCC